MRRWGCALLLAAWLGLGASGQAALPKRCDNRLGPDTLALICDPGGGSGTRFAIEADGGSSAGKPRTGIARLRGNEAFQPGERISFDLSGGSASTVVAFEVATRDGNRIVFVEPFHPAARRYQVEVGAEVATVTADDGQVRRIRFTPRVRAVSDGTPGAAVRSFVRLINGEGAASFDAACGLLSSDLRLMFNAYGDCASLLSFVLFDQEGEPYYPELRSIDVRSVRLVGRHPTIAQVALLYSFAPEHPSEPRALRVRATVALAREPEGWRIGLPETISPGTAIRGKTQLTVRQVRRRLRDYRRHAREVLGEARSRREAARPLLTGATACPGAARRASDPARDLTTKDGELARRQDAAGMDLIGASRSPSAARTCFELRFRTPLAPEVIIELGEVSVDVTGQTAVASRGDDPPSWFPVTVVVSPARDALSVVIDGPPEPGPWFVRAWRVLPAINDNYVDELEP